MMSRQERGAKGGYATTGTTLEQHRQDLQEVREYLQLNLDAKLFDVVLCCNMGYSRAGSIMKALKENV